MAYETITLDVSVRGVATITLDRPDKGNAINEQMRIELAACASELASDNNVRIVVLRANGKHFCAGADVSGPRTPEGTVPRPATLGEVLEALDRLPKPLIGVVQGAAAGAGAAIAAICDVVVALEGSFFSIPEVRMGFAPGGIQTVLMRSIGPRHYRRYAMSGERILADTALRIGMAHELCKTEEAEAVLAALVEALMLGAPKAQGLIKQAVAAAVAGEHFEMPPGMASPEAKEGIAAFKEKRKPAWYRP
jgi:methylglutaconyl-CoA hydratase